MLSLYPHSRYLAGLQRDHPIGENSPHQSVQDHAGPDPWMNGRLSPDAATARLRLNCSMRRPSGTSGDAGVKSHRCSNVQTTFAR